MDNHGILMNELSRAVLHTHDKEKSKKTFRTRRTKRRCKASRRSILLSMAIFNLITTTVTFIWLWYVEETPPPPVFGFSWWSSIRMMLVPETCISVGHLMFLIHGLTENSLSSLVISICTQLTLFLCSVMYFILFVVDIQFSCLMLVILISSYMCGRGVMLYLTYIYYWEARKKMETLER